MNKEDVVKFLGCEATVGEIMEANKHCSSLGLGRCKGCPLDQRGCTTIIPGIAILPGLSLEALKLAITK